MIVEVLDEGVVWSVCVGVRGWRLWGMWGVVAQWGLVLRTAGHYDQIRHVVPILEDLVA